MHTAPAHAAARHHTAHSAPLDSLAVWSCLCHAVHGVSQDGKQPLHYAAAKGVPLDVTQLLLEANRDAATSKDKARS